MANHQIGDKVQINVSKISKIINDAKNLGEETVEGEVTGHSTQELITGDVIDLYDVFIEDIDVNIRQLKESAIG